MAPPLPARDLQLLDNPIWNALTTAHSELALGDGPARRYPAEIGPLSGLVDQSPGSYETLRALTDSGGFTAQFLENPPVERVGWSLLRSGLMSQMIWSAATASSPLPWRRTLCCGL